MKMKLYGALIASLCLSFSAVIYADNSSDAAYADNNSASVYAENINNANYAVNNLEVTNHLQKNNSQSSEETPKPSSNLYFVGISSSVPIAATLSKTSSPGGIGVNDHVRGGIDDHVKVSSLNWYSFGAFAGRDFPINGAGKLALYASYQRFMDSKLYFKRRSQLVPGSLPDDATAKIHSDVYLLNLDYYPDFTIIRLHPFVGVGAGMARNTMGNVQEKLYPQTHNGGGIHNNPAFAARIGLSYEIITNLQIALSYQYTYVGTYKSSATWYSNDKPYPNMTAYHAKNVGYHSINLTLSYHF